MRACLALLATVLALSSLAGEAKAGQSEKAALEILSVAVEPASPGPETLCDLRVEIANRGREAASRFAFEVRVSGEALTVYEDELVLQPIPPGESAEVRLHNFWSSETGRPFPQDGKLVVEVTLREASWVRVDEASGTRRPVGQVGGLPVSSQSRRDDM